VSEHPIPRARDDTDAVKDLARDLGPDSHLQGRGQRLPLRSHLQRPAAQAGDRPRGGGGGSGGGEEADAAQREPLGSPLRASVGRGLTSSALLLDLYAPKCLEEVFSEVRD
jgi:hypothetical protein